MGNNERERAVVIEEHPDTLIEKLFYEATEEVNNGKILRKVWAVDKAYYSKQTATTVLNFEHYSLHDHTHSESILNSIAFLLGEQRLKMFSVGDLWLLLQVAYFHDIGMSVNNKYLYNLWKKDNEFKMYFQDTLNSKNVEIKAKSECIRCIDEMVLEDSQYSSDGTVEIEFDRGWPIIVKNIILSVTTEYVRKHHGDLAIQKMESYIDDKCEIDRRFYLTVADISYLHTTDFFEIFKKLQKEDTFMGICHIHPQFIAMLLRMGDLLDMDNNRFDYFILNHYGKLPHISNIHLNKHLSIRHLNITPYQISAIAKPKDIDACLATAEWFEWLEDENRNFIAYWNDVIPKNFGGCTLSICNLKIFYEDEEFDVSSNAVYEIDKQRAIQLLIGDNIYGTSLEFLREYVQNAIDANKMEFEKEWKEGHFEHLKTEDIDNCELVMPFFFKTDVFTQFPIKIRVHIDAEDMLVLEVVDSGIGIEKGELKALTTIGTGWNARKKYQETIAKLLFWLKPTAGFGIGIQAAFMVADEVTFKTKSRNETKGQIVVLRNPSKGGNVICRKGRNIKNGTTVEIKIKLHKFMDRDVFLSTNSRGKNEYDSIDFAGKDMFSEDDILKNIITGLKHYLSYNIIGSLFPIYLYNDKLLEKSIYSDYWYKTSNGKEYQLREYQSYSIEDKTYYYSFDNKFDDIYVIDQYQQKIVKVSFGVVKKSYIKFFYKGVFIPDEIEENFFVNTSINILEGDVKNTLKVNRREFIKQFPKKDVVEDSLRIALSIYLNVLFKKVKIEYETEKEESSIMRSFSKAVICAMVYAKHTDILLECIQWLSNFQNFELVNIATTRMNEKDNGLHEMKAPVNFYRLVLDVLKNNRKIFIEDNKNDIQSNSYVENDSIKQYLQKKDEILLDQNNKYKRILDAYFENEPSVILYNEKAYSVYGWYSADKQIQKNTINYKEIANSDERVIIINPSGYETLYVYKTPFRKNNWKENIPLLIMPINTLLKSKIDVAIEQKKSFEEFKRLFVDKEYEDKDPVILKDFERLVAWVVANQCESNKYKKEQIIEEYLLIIKEYYKSRIEERKNIK